MLTASPGRTIEPGRFTTLVIVPPAQPTHFTYRQYPLNRLLGVNEVGWYIFVAELGPGTRDFLLLTLWILLRAIVVLLVLSKTHKTRFIFD